MLLAQAIAIAEARSYVAALADTAITTIGSVAYDRVLIYLDAVHGDQVPALTEVRLIEPAALYRLAQQSITDLGTYGLDPLHIELVLAYLVDSWTVDHRATTQGSQVLPAWIDPMDPS